MNQFKKPLYLKHIDYEDNFTINDVDTAKVKAVFPLALPEKEHKQINLGKLLFIIMIGLMTMYTFFIICVELYKIFLQIVLGN